MGRGIRIAIFFMMKVLFLYFAVLLFIAFRDFFKVKNLDDYVVAGRNQGTFFVTFSLLATMLGASATLGICERAKVEGISAFWWLGFGALGLWLQALFFSKKIRGFSAKTLPDLVKMVVGERSGRLVALIIAVSWIGVIAAQFAGLGMFLKLLSESSSEIMIMLAAFLVILYTLLGGQLSVVKTDFVQFILFAIGIIGTFVFLLLNYSQTTEILISENQWSLFGNKFSLGQWLSFAFTISGAFLLGPDIISRNLISRSPKVARRSSFMAGFFLILFGVVIACIGIFSGAMYSFAANPLFFLTGNILPFPLAIALCIGMVCALLSSADTSLINASSILAYDLFQVKKVSFVRIVVLILGILSMLLALHGKDIISLLLSAYSIYTPGVVCPLAVAIFSHRKFFVSERFWILGVLVGGTFGVIAVFLENENSYFPLIGMFFSFVVSLLGLRKISN